MAKSELAAERKDYQSAVNSCESNRRGFAYFAEILAFATFSSMTNYPGQSLTRHISVSLVTIKWTSLAIIATLRGAATFIHALLLAI